MNKFKGLYVPADYTQNYLWSTTYCHILTTGVIRKSSCGDLRCSDCLFYGSPNNQKIFQEWQNYNISIKNRSKKLERILNENCTKTRTI